MPRYSQYCRSKQEIPPSTFFGRFSLQRMISKKIPMHLYFVSAALNIGCLLKSYTAFEALRVALAECVSLLVVAASVI